MKNSKGFTLIELLAVITIMGILMLVAIPAVSRTIENSRRDTFMDTAKAYINAIKNAAAADEIKCGSEMLSAKGTGYYLVKFDSSKESGKDLMEQGGKSSWGNAEVKGVVLIKKEVVNNRNTYDYAIMMVDVAGRGIGTANSSGVPTVVISDGNLSRADVKTSSVESGTGADYRKKFYTTMVDNTTAGNPTKSATKWNTDAIPTDIVTGCAIVM